MVNLHVVWFSTNIMYLRAGNGGASWAPAVSLVSGVGQAMPHIAVDGNRVHLIWKDLRAGHGAIFYKCDPTGNRPAQPAAVGRDRELGR